MSAAHYTLHTCLALMAAALPMLAEERFLLAAGNQLIDINRGGWVTSVLKHPGHRNIWDAWRLPDGGIFYVHRDGMPVVDKDNRLVVEHAAVRNGKDVEAPGGAVWDGGQRFAMLARVAAEIRVVDRSGSVVIRTPIPDLRPEPVHSRYRMIRRAPCGNAFWIGQDARNTLLEVEIGTGKFLSKIALDPHLTKAPRAFKCSASMPGATGADPGPRPNSAWRHGIYWACSGCPTAISCSPAATTL